MGRGLHSVLLVMLLAACLAGCYSSEGPDFASVPEGYARIPGGEHSVGSSAAEIEEALTHQGLAALEQSRVRFARELPESKVQLATFAAGIAPVSNREYLAFVQATGHPVPNLREEPWTKACSGAGLGFDANDYQRHVFPRCWREGVPPPGEEDAPVVLVSREDAQAYCAWLSSTKGIKARLPNELESEALAGPSAFPWGQSWRSLACNADPASLAPPLRARADPAGLDRTSHGVENYAGGVYEWTSSPAGRERDLGVLKGGGCWLDTPGDCRRATRRIVPSWLRHPCVGFRVVLDP